MQLIASLQFTLDFTELIFFFCRRDLRRAKAHNLINGNMEQTNRIEIKGKVGNVRISEFSDGGIANFSVVTNYIYKGRDGGGVVETMWFNVCAWKGKNTPEDFSQIRKGANVHVTGRLREREYNGSDGMIHKICEVVAGKLEILPDDMDD